MNLSQIEIELKKRTQYAYNWGRKQNDMWDNFTNYIYETNNFKELLKKTEKRLAYIKNATLGTNSSFKEKDRQDFFNYATNRWYNFHSAQAVEKIICSVDGIVPAKNGKDKLVDFSINGITFDHKTSVFPKGFGKDVEYAKTHKTELIKWLYENQSQQKRKHLENRLFIIVYNSDGKHWKLKAELSWLKNIILDYANNFKKENLVSIKLKNDESKTLADILWAIK